MAGSTFPRYGTVAMTSPAAGADLSYTATENMLVKSIRLKLVTDSNSANRRTHITIEDPSGNIYWQACTGGAETASLTHLIFATRAQVAVNTSVDDTTWRINLPPDGVYVPLGGKIKTSTTSIQVGDQYSQCVATFERA